MDKPDPTYLKDIIQTVDVKDFLDYLSEHRGEITRATCAFEDLEGNLRVCWTVADLNTVLALLTKALHMMLTTYVSVGKDPGERSNSS